MAAEKGKEGNFSFKAFTMCFKPSEISPKEEEKPSEKCPKKEEINDDTKLEVKLPDPLPKLKVADTKNKFGQRGKVETNISTTVKYIWSIWDFSKLKQENTCSYIYSDTFFTGNHPWRIVLYPHGGKRENYLSIYLSADKSLLPAGSWRKMANFKLTLHNSYFRNKTLTKEGKNEFGSGKLDWCGFPSFITLAEFQDPNNGFIVNDKCVFMAEVSVENAGHQHPNDDRLKPLVTKNNKKNKKKLEENVDHQGELLLKVE